MTDAPALSLPKDKIRVLLLEGVNDSAVALFDQAGYTESRAPAQGARRRRRCIEALKGVHMLGIRSRTQLDARRCWRRPTG